MKKKKIQKMLSLEDDTKISAASTNDAVRNNNTVDSVTAPFGGEYPTADTIVQSSLFPYTTIYPQQRDLINTFLQSLQLITQEKSSEHDTDENNFNNSNNSQLQAQVQTHAQQCTNTLSVNKKRCCPVYMLESPTGTGKSISLACSAIAWLRYMEQTHDMRMHSTSTSNNCNTATATDDDWVTNYISNHERQQIQQYNDMIAQVQLSRQSIHTMIMNIQANVTQSLLLQNNKTERRTIRQQLVRDAILDVRNQQLSKKKYRDYTVTNKKIKSTSYASNESNMNRNNNINNNNISHNEFLLDKYNSDDNDDNQDNIDLENDDDDDDEIRLQTVNSLLSSSKNGNNQNNDRHYQSMKVLRPDTTTATATAILQAKQLLDGPALDGSKYCTNRQDQNAKYVYTTKDCYNNKNTSTTTANSSKSTTAARTTTIPTIGNVQPGSGVRKIIYAARTHTQLSQFVREVHRCCNSSSIASSNTYNPNGSNINGHYNNIRVVHLGGRNNLCTNPSINRMKNEKFMSQPNGTGVSSERYITEACLDLQKGIGISSGIDNTFDDTTTNLNETHATKKRKSKKICSCPMLEGREHTIPTLGLHIQSEPTDIEEVVQMGMISNTCAYYASRSALVAAELVVLPYSMLLSKTTRDSIGLSLKEALVIVDEAHNVPEALRSIHSCQLSLPIINNALQQLLWYTHRYSDQMAGRNLFYLGQIRRILLSFQKQLSHPPTTGSTSSSSPSTTKSGMMTATELLVNRKLDNINLYRIIRFMQHSRLSQKLLGYTNYKKKLDTATATSNNDATSTGITAKSTHSDDNPYDGMSKHVSAMSIVEVFLKKLAFHGNDGKVTIDWPNTNVLSINGKENRNDDDIRGGTPRTYPSYRYVLLHPAAFFENVLEEAHALALVGGTLRPFVHVVAELLGDRCGSAILSDAAKADASTSTSKQLSNTFISTNFTAFTCDHVVSPMNVLLQCIGRGPTDQVLDLRYQTRTNKDVCDEIGRSVIQICHTVPNGVVIFLPSYSYEAFLIRHWKTSGLWNNLQAIKSIHREPKSSQYIEASLSSYAKDATTGPMGAVLFSVIGGKMSEGINFSDSMARCVIVVGLPYPDSTDPVLVEKMTALDKLQTDQGITGQSYYQNLCLRAVSQSVGRAIRHANDYASIVLMDRRYTSDERIWSGLPNWLKKGCNPCSNEDVKFSKRITEMRDFFAQKSISLTGLQT